MGTDVRKHTIPLGAESPASPQTALRALSLSINDVVYVANATARAQAITDNAPTTARPLLLLQLDTGILYQATGTTSTLGTDLWVMGGQQVTAAVTYGGLPWRAPTTQPGQAVSLIRQGGIVTLLAGKVENAASLTLPATGQNAGAIIIPAGFRPAAEVIIPTHITSTGAGTNTLGSLWVPASGSCTIQTSAAISAAAVGTVSVGIPSASWVAAG